MACRCMGRTCCWLLCRKNWLQRWKNRSGRNTRSQTPVCFWQVHHRTISESSAKKVKRKTSPTYISAVETEFHADLKRNWSRRCHLTTGVRAMASSESQVSSAAALPYLLNMLGTCLRVKNTNFFVDEVHMSGERAVLLPTVSFYVLLTLSKFWMCKQWKCI